MTKTGRTTILVSAPHEPRSLEWQCALLEASCATCFEDYRLVRLYEEHPRAEELHCMPINKLYAVRRWMEAHREARAERVLVCDPDIVFRSPLTIQAERGTVIADEFWPGVRPTGAFSASRVVQLCEALGLKCAPTRFVQAHTGVMIFHGADLLEVSALAERLTERLPTLLTEPYHKWQSEMYAWYFAAAELGMTVRTAPIAACNNWEVQLEKFPALHYCQPILSAGERVWYKHQPEALSQLLSLDPAMLDHPADALLVETARALSACGN
ncbi:MAG TPA: hypothetical protein VGW12_03990 [Pyrinomonadaceae bacterium]|nr:hypothetical protein [Pyrinomonadaceae bacterium]